MAENDLVLRLTLKSEELKKKISEATASVKGFGKNINQSFNEAKTGMSGLSSQFSVFSKSLGGIGSSISGMFAPVQALGAAIKVAFSGGPIGLFMAALTLLGTVLSSFFTRDAQGVDEFQQMWAYSKGVIGSILDDFADMGRSIWDNLVGPMSSFNDELDASGQKTKKPSWMETLKADWNDYWGNILEPLNVNGNILDEMHAVVKSTGKFLNSVNPAIQLGEFLGNLFYDTNEKGTELKLIEKDRQALHTYEFGDVNIKGSTGVSTEITKLASAAKEYKRLSMDTTLTLKEQAENARMAYESDIAKNRLLLDLKQKHLAIQEREFDALKSTRADQERLSNTRNEIFLLEKQLTTENTEMLTNMNTKERAYSESVKKSIEEVQKLNQELAKRKLIGNNTAQIATPKDIGVKVPAIMPKIIIPDKLESEFTTAVEPGIIQMADNFKQSVDSAFRGLLQGGVLSLAEGLGTAMSGGGFQDMLIGLLDLLKQFGAALIAAGMATIALKTLFANPWVAIASGFALITAVSVAKSKLQNVSSFADGGIVYGETFARVGEYAGASSNPEVIAPLNKLKQLIKPQSSSQFDGEVRFEIQGQTLVGILNKVNGFNKRM